MLPRQPHHRLSPRHQHHQIECQALFGRLWGGGNSNNNNSSSSKLAERPLYKQSEMFDLGGLQVSPMGLGTWAWGNK